MLGDSITYGGGTSDSYGSQLAALLPPNATVVNLGVNSATVQSYASTAQHQTALSQRWDTVIIMFGTNEVISHGERLDNCLPDLQCAFGQQYLHLIDSLHASRVLLMIPPHTRGGYASIDRAAPIIRGVSLARGLGDPIDLRSHVLDYVDDLHPSKAGYSSIALAVADSLCNGEREATTSGSSSSSLSADSVVAVAVLAAFVAIMCVALMARTKYTAVHGPTAVAV